MQINPRACQGNLCVPQLLNNIHGFAAIQHRIHMVRYGNCLETGRLGGLEVVLGQSCFSAEDTAEGRLVAVASSLLVQSCFELEEEGQRRFCRMELGLLGHRPRMG